MSGGNPPLNDLIQQAQSLGIWKDSFAAMPLSFLPSVLQDLITAKTEAITAEAKAITAETEKQALKTENKELKTKVITAETEKQALKTENKELKTKAITAETEIKELKTEVKKRSLEVLMYDTAPLVNRTDSAPHIVGLRHRPAKIHRVDYDYNNDDEVKVPIGATYAPRDKSIDSEAAVQWTIIDMLQPICSALSSDIRLAPNRRIAGIECDILLLYGSNCIPFAAVEIKKNGAEEYVKAIFEDDHTVPRKLKGKVQGEHLTQLKQIRIFGFNKVFGLISDGNHSMITCTGLFSQGEDPPSSIKTRSKTRSARTMNGQEKSPDNAIRVCSRQRAAKAPEPLYCSQYSDVTREHETWGQTLRVLTHFVSLALNTVKSCQFRRDVPLHTQLPARIIQLTQDGQSDMFAHSTITFHAPPNLWECLLTMTTLEKIYLFKSVGIGNNGDCCLATTKAKMSFCAVKFFADRQSAEDCANSECHLWNTIYADELPPARVHTSNEDTCLLMPYLLPIDGDKRRQALDDGSIRACLEYFADKGYHHNEVQWRHLGFFRRNPKIPATTHVYLCDLGNLTTREDKPESEWETSTAEWITESLTRLESTGSAATEH